MMHFHLNPIQFGDKPIEVIPFPLDRVVIKTNVRIRDEIAECKPEDVRDLEQKFGKIVSMIGHYGYKRTDDTTIPTRIITLYPDDAVRLKVKKVDGIWIVHKIDFTVGTLVLGHNGRSLEAYAVHFAFSVLLDLMRQVLENPNDLIHVLPGLDPMSRAYWQSLEISFQRHDPNSDLLRALANSKHKLINTPPAFRKSCATTTYENSDGSLKIICYRKDEELRTKKNKHLRKDVPDDWPIIRFEVRLKGKKLAELFEGGQWRESDEYTPKRLLSFGPTDVHNAFKSVLDGLTGVLSKPADGDGDVGEAVKRGDNLKHARVIPMMMTMMEDLRDVTFEQFFDAYFARFLSGNKTAANRNARSEMRQAWHNEVAATITSDVRSIFTDEAWVNQNGVALDMIEAMTTVRSQSVVIDPDPDIVRAYSDRKAEA